METTGQPMKIHISMETKLLLDTLGRFFTEHRGLVDVKGKVDDLHSIRKVFLIVAGKTGHILAPWKGRGSG